MNAGLCLIDDRDARDVATANGLKVCGTVGVLIQAKRAGLIQTVQEPMDLLRSRHHFWVGDDLYRRALLLAQEESI